MALLNEIIEAATDDKVPVGTLLRKCLVLEHQVRNEKFKRWLDQELDGYTGGQDEMPSYRVFNCVNRGNFIGSAYQLNDQPLSLHIMQEKDRKLVEKCVLHQPAAAYEGRPDKTTDASLPWNPHITTKYQTKFFKDSDLVLNRAWQEIPGSVLVGLLEQVRNRVLRFALELKDALPANSTDASQVPKSVVEHSVVNNIYGGNILIASHAQNFSQISQTNLAEGDSAGLVKALAELGVTQEGISALQAAMKADRDSGQESIGTKTKGWLADVRKYIAKEGAKAGFEVAKQAATKWVLQHYGLLPPG
ncbi:MULTISPECIES: hypothetical protein [unclassified Bradyrhizobium]|uniref:AbiTii domain-containing protein n=1 Tax=unclassified Bradyrhizobium TaxID=2631580 RepID=UPI00291629BC|nr:MULTISPECIES: hypothetical protein [unclassified Bradyrhizobium]